MKWTKYKHESVDRIIVLFTRPVWLFSYILIKMKWTRYIIILFVLFQGKSDY